MVFYWWSLNKEKRMLNNANKKYDVVIFGRHCFTGQLVVDTFSDNYANNKQISWAMAGRNLDKLAKVRDQLNAPANTPFNRS